MDTLKEEKNLWKKGFKVVAGLDEAGRGPLAGPVTACAVFVPDKFKISSELRKIKDSKKLTPKRREEFFKILKKHPQIKWGIGNVSEKIIDKINILEATKLAMCKAIRNLEKKLKKRKIDPVRNTPCTNPVRGKFLTGRVSNGVDFLILDGNFKINLKIPQKPIIKADNKVFSVMSASIIAKVTRDRIMKRYHRKYPCYEFSRHKGYPTRLHCKLLRKYGPCKIHRKTFGPVRNLIKKSH